MSQQLINRSPDLKRLRDEGYDVEIRSDHLVVKNVPYVNANKEIKRGALVSVLTLAGGKTDRPNTHVAHFIGEQPCHKDGREIAQIKHSAKQKRLGGDLVVDRSFSNKPQGGYEDYYHKMSTYAAIISGPAESIDPTATAQTFPAIEDSDKQSVFHYVDTASSRAGIGAVTDKLKGHKIGIVGLGGTGSYVLDFVAKTPVCEIHLFDGDRFSQHNAFRAPGAPSLDKLQEKPQKVAYLKGLYSKMHRNIIAHDAYLDDSNVELLKPLDFVFLCLDKNGVKEAIIESLEDFQVPFIDVGMGLNVTDGALGGILRVTTSTEKQRRHVREKGRIPFSDGNGNNAYSQNIQVAELNALNAALAVVKWKKLLGFYRDLENEHHSTYTLDGNEIINDDKP